MDTLACNLPVLASNNSTIPTLLRMMKKRIFNNHYFLEYNFGSRRGLFKSAYPITLKTFRFNYFNFKELILIFFAPS